MEKTKKSNNGESNTTAIKNSRLKANVVSAAKKVGFDSRDIDIDHFKKLLQSRRAKRTAPRTETQGYSYIYDSSTQDKRYGRDLSIIENRLTDLGLGGRVHRLSRFKNLKELIADDVRAGVKNVVVLGNDETFLTSLTGAFGSDVCFGFIPFVQKSEVGRLLGIANHFEGCQALGARLITSLDLGRVNSHVFFSSLKLPHCRADIICDGNFSVSAYQDRDVEIFNMHLPKNQDDMIGFSPNPRDGALELVVRKLNKLSIFGGWKHALARTGRDSIFYFREAQVISKDPVSFIADGKKMIIPKPKIEVIPKALKLIVGKNRLI